MQRDIQSMQTSYRQLRFDLHCYDRPAVCSDAKDSTVASTSEVVSCRTQLAAEEDALFLARPAQLLVAVWRDLVQGWRP